MFAATSCPSICFGGLVTVTSKPCTTFTGTVTSKGSSLSGTVTKTTPVFSPSSLVFGVVFQEYFVPSGILAAFAIPDFAIELSSAKSVSLVISIASLTALGASFTVAFASSPFVNLGSEGIIRTVSSSPTLPNLLGLSTLNPNSFIIVLGTPFSSAFRLFIVATTSPFLLISCAVFPFPAFSFSKTEAFTFLSPL